MSFCLPFTAPMNSSAISIILNAEEEPEAADYPRSEEFKGRFGPRGVLRCVATATETPGEDPRFGKWGKQHCEDTCR